MRVQILGVTSGALAAACVAAVFAAPACAAPGGKPPAAKSAPAAAGLVKLAVRPDSVTLSGRGVSQRFLVFGHYADGRLRDLTTSARVTKIGTGGVTVQGNRVTSTSNGKVQVVATIGGQKGVMNVTVQDAAAAPEWSFANEIVPIFTKAGCNSGGCHGSPSGRGGFRLSLFGYEPEYDYDQLSKEKNGKRINKDQPSQSLFLLKAVGKVPHGGGPRFKEGSEFYARILDWLRAGAPKQPEFDARLARIEIFPGDWTLDRPQQSQQILVQAVRDDGTTQDVTQYARYTSSDDSIADVDADGLLTSAGRGETSIMIRYLGGVGIVRVKVPREPLPAAAYETFKPVNYVDHLVLEKLRDVRVPPSGPASDAEFLRRAFLDTCGITPTVEEARAFLDDRDPAKRAKLIDRLLTRPEYTDYWTLRFSDLLRNNQQAKQDKGLQVFYRWIRDSMRSGKPWDQMARELITSTGSGYRSGPANWYNTGDFGADYPLLMASATSQVFLGVRIDCARCHNHPFEAWSQLDYYGFAAFFARTKLKNGPDENERIFYAANEGDVKHPRKTEVVIAPKFLGADMLKETSADEDRRVKLAEWLTSPANPWFKRSIANRIWNNFFGRGIVNPVDDYRLTNPAANPKLLDALGEKVVQYQFNLKPLMRDILMSRTYQASSVPVKGNEADKVYASHALPRRLIAESLLDAVVYATDVPEKFGPYEAGSRAISVPDNRVPNGFLDLFGRAKREVACDCERNEETNVSMVLNLLNGDTLNNRLRSDNGRVGRAVQANRSPKEITEEFYLAALARRPSDKEQAAAEKLFSKAPNLREGAEDLLWALLNTKEFIFNH